MDQSLGQRLIDELRRRGEYGMYFDFKAYRAIAAAKSPADLAWVLHKAGFGAVRVSEDAERLADGVRECGAVKTGYVLDDPGWAVWSWRLSPWTAITWTVLALADLICRWRHEGRTYPTPHATRGNVIRKPCGEFSPATHPTEKSPRL
jgi:hypothetical protein